MRLHICLQRMRMLWPQRRPPRARRCATCTTCAVVCCMQMGCAIILTCRCAATIQHSDSAVAPISWLAHDVVDRAESEDSKQINYLHTYAQQHFNTAAICAGSMDKGIYTVLLSNISNAISCNLIKKHPPLDHGLVVVVTACVNQCMQRALQQWGATALLQSVWFLCAQRDCDLILYSPAQPPSHPPSHPQSSSALRPLDLIRQCSTYFPGVLLLTHPARWLRDAHVWRHAQSPSSAVFSA
jgi:hypothetical protein